MIFGTPTVDTHNSGLLVNISYFSKVYKNLHLFLIIQSFFFSLFIIYVYFIYFYFLKLLLSAVRRPPSAVRIRRPDLPSGSALYRVPFPSDENDENSKTGKDEQHKKVIMGKI